MTASYLHTLFGDEARRLQEQAGSRSAYARMEAGRAPGGDRLSAREIQFLRVRDSFYMASVTADGWPYLQHRGGAPGFLKILGPDRIGFADYPGNRQYISLGNLATSDKVSLFFMDYPERRRLKLIGHARTTAMPDGFADAGAPEERFITIDVVGYDWNCPKYITPRFTAAEVREVIEDLQQEAAALRAENQRLRDALASR